MSVQPKVERLCGSRLLEKSNFGPPHSGFVKTTCLLDFSNLLTAAAGCMWSICDSRSGLQETRGGEARPRAVYVPTLVRKNGDKTTLIQNVTSFLNNDFWR